MTDIQIVDYLKDWLTLTVPTEVTTTVTAINGNTIQLAASAGGSPGDWMGGVLEVTSGSANRLRQIIVNNNADVINIDTSFNRNVRPAPGDSVRIYGGPLAEARIYSFEPDSVEAAVKAGKRYFVIVGFSGGELRQVGLGGQSLMSSANKHKVYGMEIACETPDVTGTASADDVYRIAQELPTLKEQVLVLGHWFRNQTSNNFHGEGPMEYAYASYQRTGSPLRLRGAIIEFDVVTT